jgi:NitT/TauT family transport system permease protein
MDYEKTRIRNLLLPPLVTFVVVIALWELSVRALAVPRFLVPPPSAVLAAVVSDAEMLAASMMTTAEGALGGFLLSVVLGTGTGLLLSLSRTV